MLPQFLKDVLDRELHNPRAVDAGANDAEIIRLTCGCTRIGAPQAVRDIERLSTELNPLAFRDLELPRNGLAPIPIAGTGDAALAYVPIGAWCRSGKCRQVQVVGQRATVTVRVTEDLIRTL